MVKDSRAWRAVQGILKSDTTLQLNNINKEREEQSIPRARVVNAATRGEERETAALLSRVMFTLANAVFVYCFLTCIFTHLLWLHWQLADLIPWVGIEPMASAVEALSSNHWSAREVPWYLLKHQYIFFFSILSHIASGICAIFVSTFWCTSEPLEACVDAGMRSKAHRTWVFSYGFRWNYWWFACFERASVSLFNKCWTLTGLRIFVGWAKKEWQ